MNVAQGEQTVCALQVVRARVWLCMCVSRRCFECEGLYAGEVMGRGRWGHRQTCFIGRLLTGEYVSGVLAVGFRRER